MSRYQRASTGLSRRAFLAGSVAAGAVLASCARSPSQSNQPSLDLKAAINRTDARRPHSGRTVTATLTPQQATVDLGGVNAHTLAYGDVIPGPLIRANVGDQVAVTVTNHLDHPTSVHWHGIALRNDMDGADPATANIDAGQSFTYRFSAPHSGTYWAHPHTGLDADYGLYLPVIIDEPRERGDYDAEWIVVLDDWTDSIGQSPQQIFDGLRGQQMGQMPGMGSMPTMGGVGSSSLLGGDAGDVRYPFYLINGRVPAAPTSFTAKPGQRIRIRLINAASDTAFRVALAGHAMTVTHTDGYPVVPTEVDAVLMGMGERYDVTVTAHDGVFPLVAAAEGKNAVARALLTTSAGASPDPGFQPTELNRRIGTVDMFTATPDVDLRLGQPDVNLQANLSGDMMHYDWAINGKPYGSNQPIGIKQGQKAMLSFTNSTTMWHPMHLHGHTFQIIKADGSPGARKDTAIVLPKQTLGVAILADNPGIWMLHCHNTYHQAAGMMTSLNYTA
ncbi:multicopper oxidase family protein [Mycobacterium sp. OTB74]|jgi:FtsP/CotA-like multicopper oxidase with cupredoxin domain|uniref:multicopper oxidase family protein n=1 Tax=Mycobacterium sp. OTB74 TaxID=1853452 RepID=UPI0024744253|nr:multicopper oxidase family protein [Mycobacterium sp. OTB74]MDH6247460.1 FtsP/CotA-like multicopper oxidase with cupredoxin domain [Mycobacterium sp. OTB74]